MSRLDEINIYASGLVYCSVCAPTDMPEDELTNLVNTKNYLGTDDLRWEKADEPFRSGEANPHVCEQNLNRKHYLFSC